MRQTLELALEALEDYVEEYGPHEKDSGVAYAITAMKELLAQPERSMKVEGPLHVVCQCDKCKAQPEQEPVAWVVESEEYNAEGERPILREIDYYNQVIDQFPAGTKLYTTPPQRTWIGLTDEEIVGCATGLIVGGMEFAKAIETKLKDKNNGS